jgi:glucose-6-phosphate dehydrogenase assembly protein OpcA
LNPFIKSVDKLIVDGSQEKALVFLQFLDNLLNNTLQGAVGGIRLSDLAWRRLETWRKCIAFSFGNEADQIPLSELKSITRVEIDCVFDFEGMPNTQSIFLIGWFTQRGGWIPESVKISDNKEIQITFTDGKMAVLRKSSSKVFEGAQIVAIIMNEIASVKRQFIAEYNTDQSGIALSKNGWETCTRGDQIHYIKDLNQADLIDAELNYIHDDTVFKSAIKQSLLLAQLIQKGLSMQGIRS